MSAPRHLGLVLFALLAAQAHAAHAWRCVDARGSVIFQDQPCNAGQTQRIVTLPDDVAPPDSSDAPPSDDADADTAPPPIPAPAAASPRVPAPRFFVCTRFDGSHYRNETGIGASHLVPFGAAGELQGDLASAYGGRNGIGVSAPGLRSPPRTPSRLGNAYTQVDDECHRAGPREACAYLRGELDDVEDKLKRAFSDTESSLKQQQADLREQLGSC